MAKKEIKNSINDVQTGAIFSPKMTLYGGLIILFFLGLMIYRHWSLGVPVGMANPEESDNIEVLE